MIDDIHILNALTMLEIFAGGHLFAGWNARRSRFPWRVALSACCCLAWAYIVPMTSLLDGLVLYGSVVYGSFFILIWGGLLFCYRESPWVVLFNAVVGYTLQHGVSGLSDMLDYVGVYEILPVPALAIVLHLGLAAILYACCYRLLSPRIRRQGRVVVDSSAMLVLSTIAILVDIVIGLFIMKLDETDHNTGYLLLLAMYNVLVCMFLLYILFTLVTNRGFELEMRVMEGMLAEQRRQFEMSSRTIDLINRKCHDLKYQIRRLGNGDVRVDRGALRELENAVDIYDSTVDSGNRALDVILTEKRLLCDQRGIELTCMADGKALSSLEDPEIYALFGNILDNAIEAVERLPQSAGRDITLIVRRQGVMVSIHEENRCAETPRFHDGLPVTAKDNEPGWHGFGMRSIRSIVEGHGGVLTVGAEHGTFRLDAVLPIAAFTETNQCR